MIPTTTMRRAQISARLGESRLEALLESAELLHASLRVEDLLRHLMRTVMGRLLVGRAAIAIRKDGEMRVALVRGIPTLTVDQIFPEKTASQAGIERILPIGDAADPIGLLGIGKAMRGELDEEEQSFLHALLGLAASGIQNAQSHDETVRLNRSLDQKIQELRALLEMVRGLASNLEPEGIAQLLALTLAGRWALRKYGVAAWREGHPLTLRQRGLDLTPLLAAKETLAGMPDAHLVPEDLHGLPAGSVLFPMRSGDEVSGVVVCGPRPADRPFLEGDLEFGAGLVAQAAVAFNNAWYFRETLVAQQLEKELAMAAAIQQTLFPASLPELQQTAIAARNRQAKQVGGDYYDVIPLAVSSPAQPHLLCVVDISGKGIFASILMGNIQATLRALLHGDSQLGPLAGRTNDLLYASTPGNRYATAFLAFYEPVTGGFRWVNCGHCDGIILRAGGEVTRLACTGLALGQFPRQSYQEETCTLEPGDILAIYSDGVSEANDLAEEEFGTDRLIDAMRRYASENPAAIVDAVFRELDRFVGEAPQFDDITLMIVKRAPSGEAP
ncbi:MAG: SpoIIE family protein phosphatase [Candidatus Sulfopaludibacter sp.]|nr:SpoIIE family protein phosphatase [Candidatus Sulfopaludibacter sp.]